MKSSKKSIASRKVKCRKCYIDMIEQGNIEGGWDYFCLKCGLRHFDDGTRALIQLPDDPGDFEWSDLIQGRKLETDT